MKDIIIQNTNEENKFGFDINFFKSSVTDKYLMLEGVASDSLIDCESEKIDPECLKSIKDQILNGDIPIYPRHQGMEWDDEMGIIEDAKIIINKALETGEEIYQLYVKLRLDRTDDKVKKLEKLLTKGRKIGMSIGGGITKVGIGSYKFKSSNGAELNKTCRVIKAVILDHICITKSPVNPRAWISNMMKSLTKIGKDQQQYEDSIIHLEEPANMSEQKQESSVPEEKEQENLEQNVSEEVAKAKNIEQEQVLAKSEPETDSQVEDLEKSKTKTIEIQQQIEKVYSSMDEVKNLLKSVITSVEKIHPNNDSEETISLQELEESIAKAIDSKISNINKSMSVYEAVENLMKDMQDAVEDNKDKFVVLCDCYKPGYRFDVYLSEVNIDNTAIVHISIWNEEYEKIACKNYMISWDNATESIVFGFDSAFEVERKWVAVNENINKGETPNKENIEKSLSDKENLDSTQREPLTKSMEGAVIEGSPYEDSVKQESVENTPTFKNAPEYVDYILKGGKEIPEYTSKFAKAIVI